MLLVVLEFGDYWMKRSPTIFQQTSSSNICASLIQKNDQDLLNVPPSKSNKTVATDLSTVQPNHNFRKLISLQKSLNLTPYVKIDPKRGAMSVKELALNSVEIPHADGIVEMPEIRESDTIQFDIEKIKSDIQLLLQNRQDLQATISECKADAQKYGDQLPSLQSEKKLKERAQLLLENPEENITKMGKVLTATQERIEKLKEQWDEHRIPLEQQIETAKRSSNSKYVSSTCYYLNFSNRKGNFKRYFIHFAPIKSHTRQMMDQIKATKEEAEELQVKLKQRATLHAKLVDEFEKNNRNVSRYVNLISLCLPSYSYLVQNAKSGVLFSTEMRIRPVYWK